MLIKNCRLISPGVDREACHIFIKGEHIVSTGTDDPTGQHAEVGEEIDASGLMAMPGFFDIHTHGAVGCDLCDTVNSVETVNKIARAKLAEGVTSYFPTTLSVGHDLLLSAMRSAAGFSGQADPPTRFHGVHIEGPYINRDCAGAQNPEFIRPPDLGEFDELRSIAPVGKVSVAPELPGALDFISAMRERHVTVSLAHTAATFAQFLEAKEAGANHLTHFCNQLLQSKTKNRTLHVYDSVNECELTAKTGIRFVIEN